MAKINWATLVRGNVIGTGFNADADQDRTGARMVVGLLPPALLSEGHRSMPYPESALAEPHSPASTHATRALRAGRSGNLASPLDSRSLAAVASQAAQRQRFAGFPVVVASVDRTFGGDWCPNTDAKRTATRKPADRQLPCSAHRKPTLSPRGWR